MPAQEDPPTQQDAPGPKDAPPQAPGRPDAPARRAQPGFDTSVAHPARVYDYWLGGKDNFAADREAAERVLAVSPGLRFRVRANRAFLARSVRYLAADAGIRQFLDIGTGIPSANNTHEVAQSVAPDARIVYVDNDPIVLVHARALLTGTEQGATAYIEADLRDTADILAQAARTLDFSQPVAIMLLGILHLISDSEDPYRIVAQLVDAVPPGSYLAISHPAIDIHPPRRRRSGATTSGCRRRRRCGITRTSAGSSTAWSWCRPAWSTCTPGGPTRASRSPRTSRRRTAASAASRPATPGVGAVAA